MKLRIKGNSIRFRLLQSEVKRLEAAGTISEETRFGSGAHQVFRYSIAVSDGVDSPYAEFTDQQMLVLIPETLALEWCRGDDVSIESEQRIDQDTNLSILIEKDYECLGRPDDPDRDDAFPHPSAS